MTIKLLLIDDHPAVRKGLKKLLSGPDIEIVAEAGDSETAIHLAEEQQPDVALLDICLPDIADGIGTVQGLHSMVPKTRILAFSALCDVDIIQVFFKEGGIGFVNKSCSVNELKDGIRHASMDKKYLCSTCNQLFIDRFIDGEAKPSNKESRLSKLTAREREVLGLLSAGLSVKEIAFKLEIKARTVGNHKENLMAKLEVNNLAELVLLSIREGVISLPPAHP